MLQSHIQYPPVLVRRAGDHGKIPVAVAIFHHQMPDRSRSGLCLVV